MMRASVVVNSCNYEPYVGAAIDSALAQTHDDVEVLVVDDGSTDGSRAVIERYGPRVRALLKDNGGQTSALNAAMEQVTGDVVVFLDADDTLAPRALARAVERFAADRGVVKVHWPLREIGPDGEARGVTHPAADLPDGDLRDELVAGGPEACVFPPTSGNAFRASFLHDEFPLPDVPTRIGSASADAYLSMLAVLAGRIAALDEVLGGYRVHGANGFGGRPLGEQIQHNVVQFEHRCTVLESRCRGLGLAVDPTAWRERSWIARMARMRERVRALLGDRASVVLVDGGEWGPEIVAPLRARPFLERDGQWWGAPADDAAAIAELDRLHREGASHVVVGWPAFWWLDHYRGFSAHLQRNGRAVLRDRDLVVFELPEAMPCG